MCSGAAIVTVAVLPTEFTYDGLGRRIHPHPIRRNEGQMTTTIPRSLRAWLGTLLWGLAAAGTCASETDELDILCGRLVRANLHDIAELQPLLGDNSHSGLEREIIDLTPRIKQLGLRDKRELLLLVLAQCDIQGGAAVWLFHAFAPDCAQLARELSVIQERTLQERLGLSPEATRQFHANLEILAHFSTETGERKPDEAPGDSASSVTPTSGTRAGSTRQPLQRCQPYATRVVYSPWNMKVALEP